MLEEEWSWNHYLPLIEFSYNNGYHTSIGMALNEALYERKLCTPLCWEEVKDKGIFGLELIQETIAKIRAIQENMKKEKDFHKSYKPTR